MLGLLPPTDGPCGKDTPPAEVDNNCYAPVCNGVACVDAWKPAGQACTYPSALADPNWDDSCVDFKCTSDGTETRTTCEPVYKPATTLCGPAPESRGKYSLFTLVFKHLFIVFRRD